MAATHTIDFDRIRAERPAGSIGDRLEALLDAALGPAVDPAIRSDAARQIVYRLRDALAVTASADDLEPRRQELTLLLAEHVVRSGGATRIDGSMQRGDFEADDWEAHLTAMQILCFVDGGYLSLVRPIAPPQGGAAGEPA